MTDCMTDGENKAYLCSQLITYLGNKRALLDFIGEAVRVVQKRLNTDKLRFFDVFSGSGIVSRYFKKNASLLIANDLELYSRIINTCYLSNAAERDMVELRGLFCFLKERLDDCEFSGTWTRGIISTLYAPQDDTHIQKHERVFYTGRNAAYVDTARALIENMPPHARPFFIAPLLAEASVHVNTGGVFKGFYKNRETGIGQFGGKIDLDFPVFSKYDCETHVYTEDANTLVFSVPETDIAYVDPPYNTHPYGSNYFMLNVIAEHKMPLHVSTVSGIPSDWNRSVYNKAKQAPQALLELIENLKAKFVLLSFNSEGFMSKDELIKQLEKKGTLRIFESQYNTFRASRNLKKRNIHTSEYLFLLEKK